jgi:hypothetical protein
MYRISYMTGFRLYAGASQGVKVRPTGQGYADDADYNAKAWLIHAIVGKVTDLLSDRVRAV